MNTTLLDQIDAIDESVFYAEYDVLACSLRHDIKTLYMEQSTNPNIINRIITTIKRLIMKLLASFQSLKMTSKIKRVQKNLNELQKRGEQQVPFFYTREKTRYLIDKYYHQKIDNSLMSILYDFDHTGMSDSRLRYTEINRLLTFVRDLTMACDEDLALDHDDISSYDGVWESVSISDVIKCLDVIENLFKQEVENAKGLQKLIDQLKITKDDVDNYRSAYNPFASSTQSTLFNELQEATVNYCKYVSSTYRLLSGDLNFVLADWDRILKGEWEKE